MAVVAVFSVHVHGGDAAEEGLGEFAPVHAPRITQDGSLTAGGSNGRLGASVKILSVQGGAMRGKSLARLRVLLALPILAAVAVQAQVPPDCGVAPTGRPWGCYLKADYPPAIYPQGDEVSSSLVIRIRENMYNPSWTGKLCQGTYVACNRDPNCTAFPPGKCITLMACQATGATCTTNSDCNSGDTCQATSTWGWRSMTLRSYGSPIDGKEIDPTDANDPNIRWGLPGPVFHARAQTLTDPTKPPGPGNPVVKQGTRIKINLYNYLPSTSYEAAHTCNPNNSTYNSCGEVLYCTNATSQTCTKQSDCPAGGACLPKSCKDTTSSSDCPSGLKCTTKQIPQKDPNCYHGDNVTNFHLHGTHVSPQRPQDFVLLNLFPYGSDADGKIPKDENGEYKENYAVGEYQVNVNPLPWNQAPGTHWYHPHKHGSTSIQVLNGMAGALIIEGAFDDWLNKFYG